MTNEFDALTSTPADAKAERVLWYGHDTVIIRKEDGENYGILRAEALFDNTIQKRKPFRTNVFPLTSGRVVKIIGLRVTHNIKFANDSDIVAFEEFANLGVKVENKEYSDIPLFDLLPYNRVQGGAVSKMSDIISSVNNVDTDPVAPADNEIWYNTTTGLLKMKTATNVIVIPTETAENYNLLALNQKFKQLGQAIVPPHNGLIELKFDPSLVDAKTDNIDVYGQRFGNGVVDGANSPIMWVKIAYVGELIRTTI